MTGTGLILRVGHQLSATLTFPWIWPSQLNSLIHHGCEQDQALTEQDFLHVLAQEWCSHHQSSSMTPVLWVASLYSSALSGSCEGQKKHSHLFSNLMKYQQKMKLSMKTRMPVLMITMQIVNGRSWKLMDNTITFWFYPIPGHRNTHCTTLKNNSAWFCQLS